MDILPRSLCRTVLLQADARDLAELREEGAQLGRVVDRVVYGAKEDDAVAGVNSHRPVNPTRGTARREDLGGGEAAVKKKNAMREKELQAGARRQKENETTEVSEESRFKHYTRSGAWDEIIHARQP